MPNTRIGDEERTFSERQSASFVAEIRVSIDEPNLSHDLADVASRRMLHPPEWNTRYSVRARAHDLLFALVRRTARRCDLFRRAAQALSFFRSVVRRDDPPLAQLSLLNRNSRAQLGTRKLNFVP